MIRGFDITFPAVPLTGDELSLRDLIRPDDRTIGYGFDVFSVQSAFLEVEKQLPAQVPTALRQRIVVSRKLATYSYFCYEFYAVSMFWSISSIEMAVKLKFSELNPGPFKLIRKRKGTETLRTATQTELDNLLQKGWRIEGMPSFNYSFRAFLAWTFESGLLPNDLPIRVQEIVNKFEFDFASEIFYEQAVKEGWLRPNCSVGDIRYCWDGLTEKQRGLYRWKNSEILIKELPHFRNYMAHPQWHNHVSVPRSPLSAYKLLIDIASRLWKETKIVES